MEKCLFTCLQGPRVLSYRTVTEFVFAYSILADVIGIFKLLLLKLLAAVALASACEMDYMAALCQLY